MFELLLAALCCTLMPGELHHIDNSVALSSTAARVAPPGFEGKPFVTHAVIVEVNGVEVRYLLVLGDGQVAGTRFDELSITMKHDGRETVSIHGRVGGARSCMPASCECHLS